MTRAQTAIAAAFFVALAAPDARADGKDVCLGAHEKGQILRKDGKTRGARASFRDCARESCPSIVRKDCAEWELELDQNQPTVVIAVIDPQENDVAAVRVLLDGALLSERVTGAALEVDPGEHTLRYELPDGHVMEQSVIVRAGEKNRKLVAQFPRATRPPPPPIPTGAPAIPGVTWVLAGAGVAALGVFTIFAIGGKNKESSLRTRCAPYCTHDDLLPMKRAYLAADIALALSAASLGAAATFFFTRSAPKTSGAARFLDLDVAPGSATIFARGEF